MKKTASDQWADPHPYDGPIQRADGRRPYNMYLWPMASDAWWTHNAQPLLLQRMAWPKRVAIVALADGRYATDGTVYSIEENKDCYGMPCVYDTREQALRVAVARFIKQCRRARHWSGANGITHEQCQLAVNWALDIVSRPHRTLPVPPPSPPRKTGLPLFDLEPVHA